MAVVTKTAPTLPDLSAAKPKQSDARINHGVMRTSCHAAEVANGDSPGSRYEIARLPSHARLHPSSILRSTGIGGLTDSDLGTDEDGDRLADGIALTATGNVPALPAIAVADAAKPLWELVGLSRDPKKELAVYLTINAAALADGVVLAELVYIVE